MPCKGCGKSGDRLLILAYPGYREHQVADVATTFGRAGWAVRVAPTNAGKELKRLQQETRYGKITAMLRWEEHAELKARGKSWREVTAECWKQGIAPVALDYTPLDHYETRMLDLYQPDATTLARAEILATIDDPVDWHQYDQRLAKWVEKTRLIYARAERVPAPPQPQPYLLAFAQFSAALNRWRLVGNVQTWLLGVQEIAKSLGMGLAVKLGPIVYPNLKTIPGAQVWNSPGANSAANTILNARLVRYAEYTVFAYSSVHGELLLTDAPVWATGRSWFTGSGAFAEADSFADLRDVPLVDTRARNRYLRWLAQRIVYPDQLSHRLRDLVYAFSTARQ